ncbi:PH domain-containing protein [Halopenitus malekzadehii]|uniref:PH domain-containing protein n=1 Tax=Halopenitus malekzadehii TaxID=1267564 RepID=A0A1H6I8C9_9EURY|nr:PH domain-containing protein [Halopenitus malekzadehii]SEH45396.1 PH domain-containing protein [Halopenitus malekzadehii]
MSGGRNPEELADAAEGDIDSDSLSKTGSFGGTYLYDQPLMEYLEGDERPAYLLRSLNQDLEVDEDGASREIPETGEEGGSEGRRYLLATDQRLLYVAGQEEGDRVRVFDYDDITAVDWDESLTAGTLSFTDSDGATYRFSTSGDAPELPGTADYIRQQAPAVDPMDSRAPDREWNPYLAAGLALLFPPLGYLYTREIWIAFASSIRVVLSYIVILVVGAYNAFVGSFIIPGLLPLLTALLVIAVFLYFHVGLAREVYRDTIALNNGRREHTVIDDAMGGFEEND